MRLSAGLLGGTLLVWSAVIGSLIALQIYLSRREGKWPGLALPLFSSAVALVLAAVISFGVLTGDHMGLRLLMLVYLLLVYHLPTALFLAIYWIVRSKKRKAKALEKMRAQDLE